MSKLQDMQLKYAQLCTQLGDVKAKQAALLAKEQAILKQIRDLDAAAGALKSKDTP